MPHKMSGKSEGRVRAANHSTTAVHSIEAQPHNASSTASAKPGLLLSQVKMS